MALPTRFADTGDFSSQGRLSETNPAEAKFLKVTADPATPITARVTPDTELRLSACLRNQAFLCHTTSSSDDHGSFAMERHAQFAEQCFCHVVPRG